MFSKERSFNPLFSFNMRGWILHLLLAGTVTSDTCSWKQHLSTWSNGARVLVRFGPYFSLSEVWSVLSVIRGSAHPFRYPRFSPSFPLPEVQHILYFIRGSAHSFLYPRFGPSFPLSEVWPILYFTRGSANPFMNLRLG